MTDLGKVIRTWRLLNNHTLLDMAKELKRQISRLSAIEHGRVQPTNEEIFCIAWFMSGLNYLEIQQKFKGRKERLDKFMNEIQKLMQ